MEQLPKRLLRAATASILVASTLGPLAPVSAATTTEQANSSPQRFFLPYTASGAQGNEVLAAASIQDENPNESEPEPGQILNDTTYTTTVGVSIIMDPSLNIAEDYWQWLFHNGPWSIDVITDGLPFEAILVREGLRITPTLEGRLSIPVTLEFGDSDLQIYNEAAFMHLDILTDPTDLPPSEQPKQPNLLFFPSVRN